MPDHREGTPTPPIVATTQSPQQLSLEDLMEAAAPVLTQYFEAREREQQREIEFDEKVLEHETRRFRYGVVAGSVLGGAVLVLAGALIFKGDAQSARDLIALVVTAAGAWFGGYGMAKRGDRSPPEE